jgi:hypothetical protein
VRKPRRRPRASGQDATDTTPEEDDMTEREETQDAPIMDGATDAAPEEKKEGAAQQRQADAALADDDDAADDLPREDLHDDLRSIKAYGEDR